MKKNKKLVILINNVHLQEKIIQEKIISIKQRRILKHIILRIIKTIKISHLTTKIQLNDVKQEEKILFVKQNSEEKIKKLIL